MTVCGQVNLIKPHPHSPEEEKLIKLLNVILLVNTRGGFLNFKLDCCLFSHDF